MVEGLLKIAIFLAYLILCSKQKDIYSFREVLGAAEGMKEDKAEVLAVFNIRGQDIRRKGGAAEAHRRE